jgi:hypothetical protein
MIDKIAVAAFLVILWLAAFWFSRYRRKLPVYAEWKIAKSRLPIWVRICEGLIVVLGWAAAFPVLFLGQYGLHRIRHPDHPSDDIFLLMLMVAAVAAVVPALLLANIASWLLPATRRANRSAFTGLPTVSYQLAIREIFSFGLGVFILCSTFAFIAAWRP